MKLLYSLAAVCGTSVIVFAGTPTPGFTLETRWVALTTPAQLGPRGTQLPNGSVVDAALNQATVSNDYRQRFELQARIVNVTGQDNLGVFLVAGDINTSSVNMSNAVLLNKDFTSTPGMGKTGFFPNGRAESYNIAGSPSPTDRVDSIIRVEAVGPITRSTVWSYNSSTNQPDPFPGPPTGQPGAGGNWARVFDLIVDLRPEDTAAGAGSITIDFAFNDGAGYSGSTGLRGWTPFLRPGEQFPEPNEFNPATELTWLAELMLGSHGEQNHSDIEIPSSFTLNVVPTPSAAALLGLGGLIASRRKRS